jgi:tRNA (guanine-N7-)-methyltransferase
LGELFVREQRFEVEVGSGDGSFLIQYAQAHPERNFLGIERLLGRLRKIDRKGLRAGLMNLRALRLEAAYSVEYLLPPASVSALHVYFPDPWPKRRHRQRRLINETFVGAVGRALRPGGRLYLRTDDADYDAQMREVCAACPELKPAETPAELAAFITDFERHFLAAGQKTRHLAYERTVHS